MLFHHETNSTSIAYFRRVPLLTFFFLTEVSLEWFSQNEGSLSLRFSDSLSELTTAYGPPGQNVDFSILLIKISVNLGSVLYSIPCKTFPEVPHKETWVPSIQHILPVPENSGLILWKRRHFFESELQRHSKTKKFWKKTKWNLPFFSEVFLIFHWTEQ